MILKIVSLVGLAIIGILIYAAIMPAEFSIARELKINASTETLFPYINNSKLSNDWMPWKKSDPDVEMVYSGPAEGVGAKTSWDSKGRMGTGQALVVESLPQKSVKTELTYTRPMEMSQIAEVSLHPEADGTIVRWTVTGQNSFIGRVFCIFMNMDKMVGSQFEDGLATLKQIAEARP